MSSDHNPSTGAVSLAGLLSRLESLNTHLEREVAASSAKQFKLLRDQRPNDGEQFAQLLGDAREECITACLGLGNYSSTLDRVGRLYSSMLDCQADPASESDEFKIAARRVARADFLDARQGYLDLRVELGRLVTDVSARHSLKARQLNQREGASGEPVSEPGIDLEAHAIALLFQHKDWTIAQIADHLKVDRKSPYKWEKFRKAAELSGRMKPRKSKESKPHRGHKTQDGGIEAYQDGGEDE